MRLDHPIFRGPLVPAIETQEIDTPGGYRNYHAGRDLPARIAAWTVQSGVVGTTVDYGLVATPHGFEDSPDAEWISGGVNTKGPESVALGRHGNWFLWGFAGDPTQMTRSARQVFLNTLVWMRQFDGRPPLQPLGRERRPGRESTLDTVAFLEGYRDHPDVAQWMKQQIPADVFVQCEGDVDRLRAWYVEHLEQLRPELVKVRLEQRDGSSHEHELWRWQLDPILLHLGVGNRSFELFEQLDWLLTAPADDPGLVALRATLAGAVPDGDVAKAVRERYLPQDAPQSAPELRRWLAQHRDRLYFSDVYGCRWFVAPEQVGGREGS